MAWPNGNVVKNEIRRLKETCSSLCDRDSVRSGVDKRDFVVHTTVVALDSSGVRRLREMDTCDTPWWLTVTNRSSNPNPTGEWWLDVWLSNNETVRHDENHVSNVANTAHADITETPSQHNGREGHTQIRHLPRDTYNTTVATDNIQVPERHTGHHQDAHMHGTKCTSKTDSFYREKIALADMSRVKHKDCHKSSKKVKIVESGNLHRDCSLKTHDSSHLMA